MKKLGVVSLSILLALLLTACGGGATGETTGQTTAGTSSSSDTITSETTTEKTAEPSAVLVEDGKTNYTVITDRAVSSQVTTVTRNFISRFENMSGVKLKLYPSSYAETEYEIVVGVTADRATSKELAEKLDYTDWSLSQKGKQIFVTAHTEGGVLAAFNALMGHIQEVDGRWVILGDIATEGQIGAGKLHNIPRCVAANSRVEGIYACSADGIEICVRGITDSEYTGYDKTLTEAGYTKYTENTMGQNRFATYNDAKAGKTVHLGYYPTLQGGTLRIISEPTGYLPATAAPAYTRVTDTTFTQIKRIGADINTAPGMSYIMQLADGSFIIIDGGPADSTDEADLLAYLKSLTPAGQKPTIAAWIITHAHSDHMALANNFIVKYNSQVDIKMAVYNFPTYTAVKNAKDVMNTQSRFQPMIDQFVDNIRKYWPQAEHFVFHTGQKLYLADAEIEFFFTHEDLYPGEFTYVNHTSTAFRITAGGKSVMLLGDCENTLCTQMGATFGSYLKSDMLQLSHHGSNGASLNLYQAIDPDICFWACSQRSFESDEKQLGTKAGYEFNAYLRDTSIKVREHYHNSVTTVIPMS